MGSDDNGRVHRKILEEDAHIVQHGESTNRSSHCYFHQGSIHMNTMKFPMGVVDETMESARSRMRVGRDHNVLPVPHDAEMTMVVHTVHGDYQSYYHVRRTQNIPNFHNGVVTDHCDDHDEVAHLRNAVYLES